MIWLILFLLAPLIALIFFIIVKEMISYLNLRFYESQGIETRYIPIFGAQWLYRANNHEADPIAPQKALAKELHGNKKGVVAFNSLFSFDPVLILTSNAIISDFYKAEVENFTRRKLAMDGLKTKNSFFYHGGPKAYKARANYAEFFSYDNMLKMMKPVHRIFYRRFSEIRNKLQSTKTGQWEEVNITPVLQEGFDDLVHEIVFGDSSLSQIPQIEGYSFSTYVEKYAHNVLGAAKHPLSWLTMGLSHKLGILKQSREAFRMKDCIVEGVFTIYNDRVKNGPRPNINLIDLMISANKKAIDNGLEDEVLSDGDIIENILTFYLAGTDTSKSLSGSSIYQLSMNQALAESLWDSIRLSILKGSSELISEDTSLDLDSSALLNQFIKESLRRYGPSHLMFHRTAVRNVKLADIKVKKGTDITVLYNGIHHLEDAFPDPYKFDVERWSPRNAKKIPNWMYAPFSLGKRNCLGQYFGEQIVKSIVTNFLTNFEIMKAENFDPTWSTFFTLEMDKTLVKLRPRNR